MTKALGAGQGTQGALASFTDPAANLGQTSGPSVKILEIRLQPEELGTVRVTMRIVDNALQVDVRSANPQTAELLQKDRHLLDRMLQAAGYKADSVSIHAMDGDRSAFQITSAPNVQNQPQGLLNGGARGDGQPGGAASNGEGGHGAGDGRSGERATENPEASHGSEDRAPDRRTDGRALYL